MAKQLTNLVEMFEESVKLHANNPLFGVKRNGEYQWLNYRDFGVMVEHFRGGLAQLGVDRDDTVAIIADNRVEWAAAAYATYGRGAKFCPMYESQLTKEWEYIVNDSGSKILVVANQEIYEKTKPFIENLDALERVIYIDGPTDHEDSFAAISELGRANPVETIHPTSDDICGFIYTSGTTGNPKGVLLSHGNISANVNAIRDLGIITKDDVSLAFLPWAHSFGQNCELHALVSLGAGCGLAENVSTIIENLAEVRPTVLMSVPRIFDRIYDGLNRRFENESPLKQTLFKNAMENSTRLREEQESGQPSLKTTLLDKFYDKVIFSKVRERFGGRLKYAVSGGAALSPDVARFIDNLHILVLEGYGLTETAPLLSANLPGARKIGSVGRPVPMVEIEIKPVEGQEKEFEEQGIGEICARGPNVMQGYHNLPDATAEVLEEDGTFHTGDMGRVDDDGFIWIVGRVKEQYKLRNGKYVAPAPLEKSIELSPFILQAMIEGTNHEYNVALLVLDMESVKPWAEEHGVSLENLASDPQVHALIEEEIRRTSTDFKGYERPKKFALLTEEWSVENGMLTPTLKLKRRKVMEKYGDLLEGLYTKESEAKTA